MTPKTKVMSDRFAEKNGLQTLEYVLHPRTTGFTFLVQHMRSSKQHQVSLKSVCREFLNLVET